MDPVDDRIARLRQIIAGHEDLMELMDVVLPISVPPIRSPSPTVSSVTTSEAKVKREKVATDEEEKVATDEEEKVATDKKEEKVATDKKQEKVATDKKQEKDTTADTDKVATDNTEEKVENKDGLALEEIFVGDGEIMEDSKSKLANTLCEKYSRKEFSEEVALRKTMDPAFSTQRSVEEIKDEHLFDKKMTFGQFNEILDRISDDLKFNREMFHQPDEVVEFDNSPNMNNSDCEYEYTPLQKRKKIVFHEEDFDY